MRRSERHHLKENELVALMDRSRTVLVERRRTIVTGATLLLVAAAAALGYVAWRNRVESRASALLADAMTVMEAQVVTPAAPAAGQSAPKPPAGTYPSDRARMEAALGKLSEVYTRYPATDSGVAARYHAANALAALGRRAEAEAQYKEVADKGGLYAEVARIGLAELLARSGQHDRAITIYKELSSNPDGGLPVDGLLMQLGRVYAQAGRRNDAQQTYTRLVQEFPESLYAADAKRELEALKKS